MEISKDNERCRSMKRSSNAARGVALAAGDERRPQGHCRDGRRIAAVTAVMTTAVMTTVAMI
jgi:hypothetical protein